MGYEPRKTYELGGLKYYLISAVLAVITTGCGNEGLFEKTDLTKSIAVGAQGVHGASSALMESARIGDKPKVESIDEHVEK